MLERSVNPDEGDELKETIKQELSEFLSKELLRRIKKYKDTGISKADTQAKLIEPLCEKLGWNMRGEEVEREFSVLREWKPVDYIFKIDDNPVLLMETRKMGDPLKGVDEVIEYGEKTGISWCVFTNGFQIEVYNTEWPDRKLFFELSLSELLKDFDAKFDTFFESSWLLSKESMRRGESEKERNREYAKRVVLDIVKEEGTIEFICGQAKLKKVSEALTRSAIKELEVRELFPFPARPPKSRLSGTKEVAATRVEAIEEELPSIELVHPQEKVPPTDAFQSLCSQIHTELIKGVFKTTVEAIRKFGRDVVEELRKKSIVYKVKEREFVKLYPHKDYFEIRIFNPDTTKWLSFYVEEENASRVKERIDKARETYKEVRKRR